MLRRMLGLRVVVRMLLMSCRIRYVYVWNVDALRWSLTTSTSTHLSTVVSIHL